MPHVITQSCCKDGSCVPVCPVDCIRPARGEAFTETAMLFIDPETCIDCGACLTECPVDAIYFDEDLPAASVTFAKMNADYFEAHPLQSDFTSEELPHPGVDPGGLRVAIVGAGPAACYAAAELLESEGVEVHLFERLPTPYGLIRAGVAPDHQDTKSVTRVFERAFQADRLTCHLNVEIGPDLTHDELLAHHDAVIYAVGASASRLLDIPGEALDGCVAAGDFVGWYNGHPDHVEHHFDLTGPRAVIVGNGNVSLDVARMLLLDDDALTATDAAEYAVTALQGSAVAEVVLLARRGPRHAAFSVAEFHALGDLPGVDVVIESSDLDAAPDDDVETRFKLDVAREFAKRPRTPGNKRIVFRFEVRPIRLLGDGAVTAIEITTAAGSQTIPTSMVIRSIGYRGTPIDDLPFEDDAAIVPNDGGRVLDVDGTPICGVYVAGWIKRGPRGVIGTNRACADQTVAKLWEDYDAGRLATPVRRGESIGKLLGDKRVRSIDWNGWRRIDAAELDEGAKAHRPRRKITNRRELIDISTSLRTSR